jgi:hypothetical protein
MTPEQRKVLEGHVNEIAKILHADAVEQGMALRELQRMNDPAILIGA